LLWILQNTKDKEKAIINMFNSPHEKGRTTRMSSEALEDRVEWAQEEM